MKEMTLEYPEVLEMAVQTTPEELGAQIRLMAALRMFELGKLSSGKAAELAGMSRAEFCGCRSNRSGGCGGGARSVAAHSNRRAD